MPVYSLDFLGSLYKLRKRESAQFKTVLELHNMEIHQNVIGCQLSKVENIGGRGV